MAVRYIDVGDIQIDSSYRFNIDENGELHKERQNDGVTVPKMYLLFDSYHRPINTANEYLIHCKAVDKNVDIKSTAKGLMHFFDFLESNNLQWDKMPRPRHKRPLYLFRDYLQALHDSIDPATGKRGLASTTAKSYRGAAVGMYSYWLSIGNIFERDPCRFYEASIKDERMLGHITKSISVQMTDLKIKARDKSKGSKIPNHLRPLLKNSTPELQSLISVLSRGVGYVEVKGVISKKAISIETTLAVLIGLYTGLRRMEILTLTSELIDTPKSASGATTIYIGPSINCHTKGGESGEIKIPHWLMRILLKYKRSSRYKKRLKKFNESSASSFAKKYPPLLLNNQGEQYSENTINARWGEIRKAIQVDCGLTAFSHKFHNLRPTYATYLTVALLQLRHPKGHKNAGEPVLTRDQVEAEVQARLRHSDPSTTALYVKFWEDAELGRNSDKLYQEGLDQIYGDDQSLMVWDSLIEGAE
jgi:integrase